MSSSMDAKTKSRSSSNARVTLLATVAILVVINVFLSPRFFGRLDLTDKGIHTLDPASIAIVQDLEEVTVQVFISDPLPDTMKRGYRTLRLRGVAQAFQDKLEEYQAYSGGTLKIVRVRGDVEKEAEKAKLSLFSSDEAKIEGSKVEFQQYALGATFHYKNVKEVYPVALRPAEFEQEITWILSRLKDKYEKTLLQKDMLSSGKEVFDAVKACQGAVSDALKGESSSVTEEGLKGLIASAERSGETLKALQEQREGIDSICNGIQTALAEHQQVLRKHSNDYVNILLDSIIQYKDAYQQFSDALGSPQPEVAQMALQIGPALEQVFRGIDTDHDNLVNSPGRKRVGIVCGQGEFCPFRGMQPVVQSQMAAIMGQQNPMVQQFMGQAEQLEERIHQINEGVGNFIKRQMKKDIVQIDLSMPVPNDVEALVILGPDGAYSDLDLYHLDQFILRGKSVAVFEKTWDVSVANIEASTDIAGEDKPGYTALLETSDSLRKLLTHYGIQVNTDLILEPFQHEPILLTQWQSFRGRLVPAGQGVSPYPLLPIFQEMNRENPLFTTRDTLSLPYASSLTLQSREGLQVEGLVYTSMDGIVVQGTGLQSMPLLPPENLRWARTQVATGKTPVVALSTGKTESYFKGKEKPVGADSAQEAESDLASVRLDEGPVRLLVFGSALGLEGLNAADVLNGFNVESLTTGGVQFLTDLRSYATRFTNWQLRVEQIGEVINQNLSFLQGVFDWSVKDEALVAIRGKMHQRRPLTQLPEESQSLVTYANILGVPVVFILFGLIRYSFRKKRTSRFLID